MQNPLLYGYKETMGPAGDSVITRFGPYNYLGAARELYKSTRNQDFWRRYDERDIYRVAYELRSDIAEYLVLNGETGPMAVQKQHAIMHRASQFLGNALQDVMKVENDNFGKNREGLMLLSAFLASELSGNDLRIARGLFALEPYQYVDNGSWITVTDTLKWGFTAGAFGAATVSIGSLAIGVSDQVKGEQLAWTFFGFAVPATIAMVASDHLKESRDASLQNNPAYIQRQAEIRQSAASEASDFVQSIVTHTIDD